MSGLGSAANSSLGPALAPSDFRRFVELNAPPDRLVADPSRARAFAAILAPVEGALLQGPDAFAATFPGCVGRAMASFGWAWNGFYVLAQDGRLHLGPAHGPPVCSPLESVGGALSSGMCFDALAMNQTLATEDVSSWPGYVSCDASSGLATLASIVCPVRDSVGAPFAVWDLDATEPIEPGDVRFMDVLLSTAARCVALSTTSLFPS